MGIANHIDDKGFWSEAVGETTTSTTITGSFNVYGDFTARSVVSGITSTTIFDGATKSDLFVMANAFGGSFSVVLPPINNNGFRITIKKIDQTINTVTITGTSSTEKIDEENSKILSQPFSTIRLISYSNKWWIF